MNAELSECPECGAPVVITDNQVILDPATEWDEYRASWTLMRMGGQLWATNGDPSIDGRGHPLHDHQIPGSVMSG
jgi:hypothetical protein